MTLTPAPAASDPGRPDSVFTWHFTAATGNRWGGTLIADSADFAPGDTIAGAAGTYTILTEEERGADLSPLGLHDGEVRVEWYRDARTSTFLPLRGGATHVAGSGGLGTEQDAAWTTSGWSDFGLGGLVQAGAGFALAEVRFTWVFHANSGDRWGGVLFGAADSHAPGDEIATAAGVYRITAETPLTGDEVHPLLAVQYTGRYFDGGTGLDLRILGTDGSVYHGMAGLGSESGQVWTGRALASIGQGGALQADAAADAVGFAAPRLATAQFGAGPAAGGWANNDLYPRMTGDINGDGRTDIVGFGEAGALVALGTEGGGFAPLRLGLANFGASAQAGGWISNTVYPRMLADVNGDGRADLAAFGEAGVFVALGNVLGGFDAPRQALSGFGVSLQAGGWFSNDVYPRILADMNGDGRADLVAFATDGVYLALGEASGTFAAARRVLQQFGAGPSAGGWFSDSVYPRRVADMNGDGHADIVGFGSDGVFVAHGRGDGSFGALALVARQFGAGPQAGGWDRQDTYPRFIADVNGDGRADLIGFGSLGVYVAAAQRGGGFAAPVLALAGFGEAPQAGGWTSNTRYPRDLADINGDGRADIIAFAEAGVFVATSTVPDLI